MGKGAPSTQCRCGRSHAWPGLLCFGRKLEKTLGAKRASPLPVYKTLQIRASPFLWPLWKSCSMRVKAPKGYKPTWERRHGHVKYCKYREAHSRRSGGSGLGRAKEPAMLPGRTPRGRRRDERDRLRPQGRGSQRETPSPAERLPAGPQGLFSPPSLRAQPPHPAQLHEEL